MTFMLAILRCRKAATAIEYSLVACLIAIAIVGALTQLGGQSNGVLSDVYADVSDAMAGNR